MVEEETKKRLKGNNGQSAAAPPFPIGVQPKAAHSTAVEEKYIDAALVCCCDLRFLDLFCSDSVCLMLHRPLGMFTTPAMVVYQNDLAKSYKPPSKDMVKRRLLQMANSGPPVCLFV